MNIVALLKYMIQKKGSDMHIRANGPVYIRVDGSLEPIAGSASNPKAVEELAYKIMTPRARKIFDESMECDFSFSGEGLGRYRVNAYRQRGLVALALRAVSAEIPSLDALMLPVEPLRKLASARRGMVLVTGVTGSGKSCTLAAMIDYINQARDEHIITLEDPIEFLHRDKKSIITQREIGLDTNGFVEALRAAMRQNPDVILVGEMRDLETTRAALSAAQTGHLVFATLHTIDAVQTVTRIVDMFPPHQQGQIRLQLADSLNGVVSQRLLPKIGGGRVPAIEILFVTGNVRKLIEENKNLGIAEAIQKGGYYGMQTFNQSLVQIHKQGLVTLEEAMAAASNPDDFMLAVRGIQQGADAVPK